jgi:hypothetical protein
MKNEVLQKSHSTLSSIRSFKKLGGSNNDSIDYNDLIRALRGKKRKGSGNSNSFDKDNIKLTKNEFADLLERLRSDVLQEVKH